MRPDPGNEKIVTYMNAPIFDYTHTNSYMVGDSARRWTIVDFLNDKREYIHAEIYTYRRINTYVHTSIQISITYTATRSGQAFGSSAFYHPQHSLLPKPVIL